MKKLSVGKYKPLDPRTQVVNGKSETMPGVTPAPSIQLCLLIYAFTQPTLGCTANSRWTDYGSAMAAVYLAITHLIQTPVWPQPHETEQVHSASCSQCTGAQYLPSAWVLILVNMRYLCPQLLFGEKGVPTSLQAASLTSSRLPQLRRLCMEKEESIRLEFTHLGPVFLVVQLSTCGSSSQWLLLTWTPSFIKWEVGWRTLSDKTKYTNPFEKPRIDFWFVFYRGSVIA